MKIHSILDTSARVPSIAKIETGNMPDIRFLIDLTTSRQYKDRNAVGIVRVEREIGRAFLLSGFIVEFFHFDLGAGEFFKIGRPEAAAILGETKGALDGAAAPPRMATKTPRSPEQADDDDLRLFLGQLKNRLGTVAKIAEAAAHPQDNDEVVLEFFNGDVIISAGLLWDGNFMELLYAVKQQMRINVIQVVYDVIPTIIPEFCVPGMNIRFPKYLLDAAWTADALYCISDCTLRDVDNYLRAHKLPAPSLHRIELGTDVPDEGRGSLEIRTSLDANDFTLYVSTIEPRKNHAMLFHVWRQLYQTDRDALIPLVIVGRAWWNSSDLVSMIKSAEYLSPEFIKIMTDVSDDDLDWLYRNARFTLYPSLYEGWGLPVAESLARGKFCIAADTSSIPEVAAGFADLIDPLDLVTWTKRIRHYLRAPDDVRKLEAEIRRGYKVMSWRTAMERFVASVAQEAQRLQGVASTGPVAVGR